MRTVLRVLGGQNSMYKLQNPFVLTVVELIITPLKLLELEIKKLTLLSTDGREAKTNS